MLIRSKLIYIFAIFFLWTISLFSPRVLFVKLKKIISPHSHWWCKWDTQVYCKQNGRKVSKHEFFSSNFSRKKKHVFSMAISDLYDLDNSDLQRIARERGLNPGGDVFSHILWKIIILIDSIHTIKNEVLINRIIQWENENEGKFMDISRNFKLYAFFLLWAY